jgi:hypothetical protein
MPLPGKATAQIDKKNHGKADSADGQEVVPGSDELSFEQMKAMGQDLKKMFQQVSTEDLEKIREIRSQEEKEEKTGKKKKKKDDRINLEDITTELAARKGGLPDHIAALPADHPLRRRWEQGFRQRADGTWVNQAGLEYHDQFGLAKEKKQAFLLIPILILGIIVIVLGNWYADQLTDTRKEIVKTVKFKGLLQDDPKVKEKLRTAFKSHSLPKVSGIMNDIKKIRRNFSSFKDNPEQGSYIQHIKRHNKKFRGKDALQWRAKLIRKPSS